MTPVKKIKPPRWYKGEKFEYWEELKTKGKVVAYFKYEAGRYSGKRKVEKYLKVFENGMAVSVNVTMMEINITQSLGTPFKLRNSTKAEWDKALKLFLKQII